MKKPQYIILKVLEIVGYTDKKEKFAEDFLKIINQKTFIDLIQSLPLDKRKNIIKELNSTSDISELVEKKVQIYFSNEYIEETLKNNARDVMNDYIKTVLPSLSPAQKDTLTNYFSRLSKSI